jgi:hypothetical protein
VSPEYCGRDRRASVREFVRTKALAEGVYSVMQVPEESPSARRAVATHARSPRGIGDQLDGAIAFATLHAPERTRARIWAPVERVSVFTFGHRLSARGGHGFSPRRAFADTRCSVEMWTVEALQGRSRHGEDRDPKVLVVRRSP